MGIPLVETGMGLYHSIPKSDNQPRLWARSHKHPRCQCGGWHRKGGPAAPPLPRPGGEDPRRYCVGPDGFPKPFFANRGPFATSRADDSLV